MATSNIPEIINNFNVYTGGTQLIGTSGSITLPTLEAITETMSGAGILGEYDTAVIGQYSSMEQEIPFRILESDIFSIMDPSTGVNLTFRASQQSTVKSTAALAYKQMRIVERGRLKSFTPGKLEMGKQMDASVTLTVLYILVEIDGKTMLEYDKLNDVFILNQTDMLKKIRSYC